MKRSILYGVMLVSVVVIVIFMAVFLPHFQNEIRYSGGVLEIEFEDGSKQYVANGGVIQVAKGSKCILRVVAPLSDNNYKLYRQNSDVVGKDEVVEFDEVKTYFFDLYESGGNCRSFYRVEVV